MGIRVKIPYQLWFQLLHGDLYPFNSYIALFFQRLFFLVCGIEFCKLILLQIKCVCLLIFICLCSLLIPYCTPVKGRVPAPLPRIG